MANVHIDLIDCFKMLNTKDVRVAIIKAEGKAFTAGLDVMDAGENVFSRVAEHSEDVGRKGIVMERILKTMQDSYTVAEESNFPVICLMHGYVIGAGIDLAAACDIRLATKDANFTIKEVDIGLAADLGTLQRFPKVVKSRSWAKELAHTARYFGSEEALENGFLSNIYDSREEMEESALKMAKTIASKIPAATAGLKDAIVYSRDHTISEGLEHTRILSAAILQSEDNLQKSIDILSKTNPKLAKL